MVGQSGAEKRIDPGEARNASEGTAAPEQARPELVANAGEMATSTQVELLSREAMLDITYPHGESD